jgi:hypothetical protein
VVPAGAVRPAVVCSRHCIALHHDACRGGGATSEAEEEAGPPGPRGFLIEASANIVVKAESMRVSAIRRPLAARGPPLLL